MGKSAVSGCFLIVFWKRVLFSAFPGNAVFVIWKVALLMLHEIRQVSDFCWTQARTSPKQKEMSIWLAFETVVRSPERRECEP
jgi:hypothetical protein